MLDWQHPITAHLTGDPAGPSPRPAALDTSPLEPARASLFPAGSVTVGRPYNIAAYSYNAGAMPPSGARWVGWADQRPTLAPHPRACLPGTEAAALHAPATAAFTWGPAKSRCLTAEAAGLASTVRPTRSAEDRKLGMVIVARSSDTHRDGAPMTRGGGGEAQLATLRHIGFVVRESTPLSDHVAETD